MRLHPELHPATLGQVLPAQITADIRMGSVTGLGYKEEVKEEGEK
jgi:hypothetical protein